MNEKTSTHFTKQNQKEKESRFFHLEKKSLEITLWKKGVSAREAFSVVRFDKDQMALLVSGDKTSLGDEDVLLTFLINGVNYFGQGKLKGVSGGMYKLFLQEELYKSERRESFRLLTYPHYDAYIHIPKFEDPNIQKSNVVSLNTKTSETGLFKNFLQIVDSDTETIKEGFTKFRVLDLSVSGLSFQIGEIEKEYLETQRTLSPIYLYFNEEILISSIEIRYIVPLIRNTGAAFKVGIQFLDIDTTTDQKLGKIINKAMRSFDSDFEDFLK